MPLPAAVEATLQGAFLSVLSSVSAQYIHSMRDGVELRIDYIPVLKFVLFTILVTPPNFLWQSWLESTFPQKPSTALHPKKSDEKAPEPKLSYRNTIIKLLLDQTLGAAVNTLAFSFFTRTLSQAMSHAPVEHNIMKAIGYWNSGGAMEFDKVDFAAVWQQCKDEFWPILMAGWKLWPLVSLVNFTLVKDLQMRNFIGGAAGIGWGTYMSLLASGSE